MFLKKVLILTFIIILASCSLDKSNPLDPSNSGIQAPGKVTGIEVDKISPTIIEIRWNSMINIDGYYIYRSGSYYGHYNQICESTPSDTLYIDHDISSELYYWYKMSAFISVGNKKLEGYRSEPKTRN